MAISCVPDPFFGCEYAESSGSDEPDVGRAALGYEAAERATPLHQVLDRLVLLTGVVVRRQVGILLELSVGDRDVHRVAEVLQVVEGHLLHLVRRVAPLEVRTEPVALDRLGDDDGGLALVLYGRLVRRIHLPVVVTAALEAPDLVVAVVLHERERALVATEEVLAHVRAALGLERLVVAVRA